MIKYTTLGNLIAPAKVIRCGKGSFPVLSMTMHDGIVLQSERFKKSLASIDQSDYKVVKRGQLVVGFPIDEGVLYVQKAADEGIMSPAYNVWDIDTEKVDADFLELCLHSPQSMQYYKDKLRGTTARRRSIPTADLLALRIRLPDMQTQREVVAIMRKTEAVIAARQEQLNSFEQLVKSRFIELFGDPILNPNGWKTEKAETHIDLLSGFPFDSSQYTESGDNICGGLIIMPQRIEWNDCKHWCSIEGYEEYALKKNDIVIALDRPWISEGFKIAMVDAEHLPALLIQRTARIRAIGISQFYLMYCFLLGGFDKHCNITGSLVPHISAKDIRSFSIMLPPLELQEQFATFVEQVDKSKLAVQKGLQELELLKKSLMQQYFG